MKKRATYLNVEDDREKSREREKDKGGGRGERVRKGMNREKKGGRIQDEDKAG